MTTIINKETIVAITNTIDVVEAMKKGFIAYSNGKAVVPPVAELLFDNPKGETHIKYGYIKEEDYFVIKIASGFYENTKLGISSSQGMLLLGSQHTGETKGILLDEGYLTNIRTAAAGALVGKYFAPKQLKGIGVIGTGIQGQLQLSLLLKEQSCETIWVWGRNLEKATHFKEVFAKKSVKIRIASSPSELAQHCNYIITTTAATSPLLKAEDIQSGTHITAIGADTAEKQELDSDILAQAAIVVTDSIPQSKSRGEVFRAERNGVSMKGKVIELGKAIQDSDLCRTNDHQITVVDLTGVAVQDIMIAEAVYTKYLSKQV